eukprot:c21839_g1_i1 orf=601-5622(-)
MASGRKNRGSRHRSHRHKQQKGEDSGDSDAEQNLRHGPNPNPNPNSSSPWTMEPLPPNVEGPSVLKQPDMENADRDSQHVLQGSSVKRRKEILPVAGDAASVMDRWDGGGGADEAATLAFLGVTERNSIMLGDGSNRKESRGESEGRNNKGKGRATPAASSSKGLERADSNPNESSAQTSTMADTGRDFKADGSTDGNPTEFAAVHMPGFDGSETAKARVSKSFVKGKEVEDASSLAITSGDVERKRARKGDLSQKPRRSEATGNLVTGESKGEHHSVLEKGTAGVFQDVVRNLELEKELESRIRRRSEGSGDRDRWRDGVKERDAKGSRFHSEEQYENEVRLKDEKVRQEKPKDDGSVKTGRERSSSRHRDESWKTARHLEDKHKEDGLNVGGGREGWLKYEKDHEQRRKSDRGRGDRSFEGRGKDDKQEEVMSNKEDPKNVRDKDSFKDTKERDGRVSEGRHKENRSKDSRYKDEKDRDGKAKSEGGITDDRRITSENHKKEYPNQQKEEKLTADSHQEELKRESEKAKEDRMKLKDRSGKFEENAKDEKEKLDKRREEGSTYVKSKHEKRRGESEQEDAGRHREDSALDGVVDGRGKKRSEREQDYSVKYSKRESEEGVVDKQQDDKDREERQKHDTHTQRENQQVNGRQAENAGKYEKLHDANDRDGNYRDAWVSGERGGREKAKDDGNRHSKRRDDSQERRWGGGIQDERAKNSKEIYDRQKHPREMDERHRYGLFSAGKQRGERGKDDRKQIEKLKEDRHEEMPVPVFERLGGTKEARRTDGGDKDGRRVNLDKGYEHLTKKSKDLDGQSKPKGARDPIESRESKSHATNKGDRTALKASRSTSLQDQERVLSVAGAKDASTSEILSKKTLDSDTFDLTTTADRRPRGRPAEELSSLLHEDRALHDKSGRKSKFEPSVSSSSGSRRPREQNWHMMNHVDQGKSYPGLDEEVRSWEPRVPNQDSDDERRRPFSHERIREPLSPRAPLARGHDDFVRGPESILSKEATVPKRKHDTFSQGSAGPTKLRRVDDASNERLDWSHQGTQGNRVPSDGPMARSLPPNRHLGSSALLPPPPPYRPGVDNPTVMGAPSNFVEGSNARDSGRYDRKVGGGHSRRSEMVGPGDTWGGFGMGNWNAHNQGPVPGSGSMFPAFPQMASGFLGMGQQFHVPQVFGPNGSRPVNIGFGGRFRMGEGGPGFPGHASDHGPAMGWHRFSDGSESHRPLSGFMHAWEGSGRYTDERQRFAHPDWDQFSQGLPGGGWDGVSEPWQGQVGDANFDVNPSHRQREDLYQARIEEVPWPESEAEKAQVVEDTMPETPEISRMRMNDVIENYVSKASKQTKERMQRMLVHADVCADLVDAELYKEYLSLLPPSEAKKREASIQDYIGGSAVFIDEDLEFEVDSEAQDLLLSMTPCATFLPSLSENAYKAALRVFQRPVQQNLVQKSVVGSFLLPKSLSGILRPSLNTGSLNGDGPAIIEDEACMLLGSAGGTQIDIAEAKETVEASRLEEGVGLSTAVSVPEELDDTGLVDDGTAVLPGENARSTQLGHTATVENLGEQECPVNETGELSTDCLSASQVVDSDQLREKIEDSISSSPNHLEVPQVVEWQDLKGEVVEDMGVDSEALTLSSRKMEELGERFDKSEAIMIDDRKGKHRHQACLDNAHANLP